jgi:hypothetical protein
VTNLPTFSGSKSPCEYEISHQITAKNSHDIMKLMKNISKVHRHCPSTRVVKTSVNIFRWLTFDCTTLQSPFFKTARLFNFLTVPGR